MFSYIAQIKEPKDKAMKEYPNRIDRENINQARNGGMELLNSIQVIPDPANRCSIVVNENLGTLQKTINQRIANGWTTIGGFCIDPDND